MATNTELTNPNRVVTTDLLTSFRKAIDTYYSGTTTVAVGGISKGTTFTNATPNDIITAMLSPYVASTCSAFSANPAFGVKELGTTVTLVTGSVTITQGSQAWTEHSISIASGSTTYGSVAAGSVTSATTSVSLSGSITANTTLTATVNDGKNNATRTGAYTFVDPYYYGVVDDITTITGGTSLSSLTKLTQSKGSKTLTLSPSAQYIVFAYPASYGTLSSIKDANNFENIGGFTYSTQNMTVTSGSVSYNIYYTTGVKTASGFKLTFTY